MLASERTLPPGRRRPVCCTPQGGRHSPYFECHRCATGQTKLFNLSDSNYIQSMLTYSTPPIPRPISPRRRLHLPALSQLHVTAIAVCGRRRALSTGRLREPQTETQRRGAPLPRRGWVQVASPMEAAGGRNPACAGCSTSTGRFAGRGSTGPCCPMSKAPRGCRTPQGALRLTNQEPVAAVSCQAH
jgi:hypothetical protein